MRAWFKLSQKFVPLHTVPTEGIFRICNTHAICQHPLRQETPWSPVLDCLSFMILLRERSVTKRVVIQLQTSETFRWQSLESTWSSWETGVRWNLSLQWEQQQFSFVISVKSVLVLHFLPAMQRLHFMITEGTTCQQLLSHTSCDKLFEGSFYCTKQLWLDRAEEPEIKPLMVRFTDDLLYRTLTAGLTRVLDETWVELKGFVSCSVFHCFVFFLLSLCWGLWHTERTQ